jgi:hypothetical protein
MGRHINRVNYHSGFKLYKYGEVYVRLLHTFVYEVTINKYWVKGYCQIDSKLYEVDKLLHIKKECIVTNYNGYMIEKRISLIGVPKEFIEELNLKQEE